MVHAYFPEFLGKAMTLIDKYDKRSEFLGKILNEI